MSTGSYEVLAEPAGLPVVRSVSGSQQPTTQDSVYECIRSHPGIHLRKISRELGLAIGDVQYHLNRLEKEGRVRSVRRGLYRFFYSASIFGDEYASVIGVLSQETPREIMLHLVESPDSTQEELAALLGLSQPTISWHMKRLVELGLIAREQAGRTYVYRIVGSASEIAAFVRSYHPSVWEKWSGRLADIVLSFSSGEGGRG